MQSNIDTVKPDPIDENEFRCGFGMARVATLDVIEGIPSQSKNSLRMGYLAYHSLLTGSFNTTDEIVAAELAEKFNLTPTSKI